MVIAQHKSEKLRVGALSVVLGIVFGFAWIPIERLPAQEQSASGANVRFRRMADGKEWLTRNLSVSTDRSYCYNDAEENCRQYGRLYTWASARKACQSLGDGWRLPTDDEWRLLAKQYGGVHDDSGTSGRAAFEALLVGGNSGFDIVLSGGRDGSGQYARLDAHGFYWTASENDAATAPYYNFGKGSGTLYRQSDGEKERAFAVRCVRE